MQEGGRLLAALLAKGTIVDYQNCRLSESYFVEQEVELFKFVEAHVEKYAQLPSLEVVVTKFNALPKAPEPVTYYYDQVEQRFTQRRLNRTLLDCNELMKMQDYGSTRMKMAEVVAELDHSGIRKSISDFRMDAWPLVAANYYATMYQHKPPGLFFGWPNFDKQCEGMGGGDLVCTVGRPGMGKTMLTLNAPLYTWQYKQGIPLYVSLEMELLDICQRLVAMYAPWGMTAVQTSNITQFGMKTLTKQMEDAKQFQNPFWIVDGRHVRTAQDVRSLVAMLHPSCVVIDAAYRLQTPYRTISLKDRIDYNVEWLCDEVYKKYAVPGYHSYQLNRDAAKKIKKGKETPDLEDIYYSDAIGQFAAIVLGLFEPDSIETLLRREITIMKGRRGQKGTFNINWDFMKMNFGEIDPNADKALQEMQFVE